MADVPTFENFLQLQETINPAKYFEKMEFITPGMWRFMFKPLPTLEQLLEAVQANQLEVVEDEEDAATLREQEKEMFKLKRFQEDPALRLDDIDLEESILAGFDPILHNLNESQEAEQLDQQFADMANRYREPDIIEREKDTQATLEEKKAKQRSFLMDQQRAEELFRTQTSPRRSYHPSQPIAPPTQHLKMPTPQARGPSAGSATRTRSPSQVGPSGSSTSRIISPQAGPSRDVTPSRTQSPRRSPSPRLKMPSLQATGPLAGSATRTISPQAGPSRDVTPSRTRSPRRSPSPRSPRRGIVDPTDIQPQTSERRGTFGPTHPQPQHQPPLIQPTAEIKPKPRVPLQHGKPPVRRPPVAPIPKVQLFRRGGQGGAATVQVGGEGRGGGVPPPGAPVVQRGTRSRIGRGGSSIPHISRGLIGQQSSRANVHLPGQSGSRVPRAGRGPRSPPRAKPGSEEKRQSEIREAILCEIEERVHLNRGDPAFPSKLFNYIVPNSFLDVTQG